jgi:hypothetical protein
MASSHFYEGYRSNVSANRSGERSNFTGASVATKKLSNSSSAAVDAKRRSDNASLHLLFAAILS